MNVNIPKIFVLAFVFFVLFILSTNLPQVYNLSWVGMFFFASVFYDFVQRLGKSIPIQHLMLIIAFLQWFFAPFLAYHLYPDSDFYFMQVPEETYMSFIVPAILAFYLGLTLKLKSFEANYDDLYYKSRTDKVLVKRGYFLYFLGIASMFLVFIVPSGLKFAFFLLSKLHFIGAFYLLAANAPYKYLWLAGAFLPALLSAGQSSVFHDLLLWGGFAFIIYAFLKQIGIFRKIVIIGIGAILIMFIQYVKAEYRDVLNVSPMVAQQNESGTNVMMDVATKKYAEEGISEDFFQGLVDRLNQGWIIARIMYVVPDFEPYAEGETIQEGLIAALVPRVFNPNKVKSGGANFERFTGMTLIGTSMNIGLIGEAYANYGINGGIIFMLIIGLFFNFSLYLLKRSSLKYYEVFLWIPFLFLYVVKAEDDFATMINQFTKAVLVCVFIFWILKKVYPRYQIEDDQLLK